MSGYQVHRMFRNTELLKIAACVPLGSSLSFYCERKDKGSKAKLVRRVAAATVTAAAARVVVAATAVAARATAAAAKG